MKNPDGGSYINPRVVRTLKVYRNFRNQAVPVQWREDADILSLPVVEGDTAHWVFGDASSICTASRQSSSHYLGECEIGERPSGRIFLAYSPRQTRR